MDLGDILMIGFITFLIMIGLVVAIFGVEENTEYISHATNFENYIILYETDGKNVKILDLLQERE